MTASTARYSALGLQEGDIGSFPTSRSAASSFDSGTLYSRDRKPDANGRKERTSRWLSSLAYIISLPMMLHFAVLALYIALCVVWITGAEENIRVALTDASHVQTWLNLISHAIMLALSTAIVAVIQPIATRSPFGNLPQPLTSLSDKILSWSGLGSSLLNLYHNLRFPATLSNAIITTLYFSTLSGLGISSSFLFNVPAVNETDTRNDVVTRIGSPSVSGFTGLNSTTPSDFLGLVFDWYRSGMGVGMLNSDNASVYPGLSANRVYDTLLSPMPASSNATAMVTYTDYDVKCGSIPRANYFSSYNQDVHEGGSIPSFGIQRDSIILNITIAFPGDNSMEIEDMLAIPHSPNVSNIALDNVVGQLWQPADILLRVPNSGYFSRNIVLYNIYNKTGPVSRSQPIRDSANSKGSPWPLSYEIPGETDHATVHSELRIQVIGCSLSTRTGLAAIDATTNQLLDLPNSLLGANANSTWADWGPDSNASNALEDTWSTMFIPKTGSIGLWDDQSIPNSQTSGKWSCITYVNGGQDADSVHIPTWDENEVRNMYEFCHVPTSIEDYLTTSLFGPVTRRNYTTGDAVRDPSLANATLGALESALARATAMTMWSAAGGNVLEITTVVREKDTDGVPNSVIYASSNGSTSVVEQVLAARIKFNVPSLIIGTVLAAVLSALGLYILVRGDAARSGDAPIEDAGLLSLMTLDNSAIAARLSSSSMHTAQERRRAGNFLVGTLNGRLVLIEDIDHD